MDAAAPLLVQSRERPIPLCGRRDLVVQHVCYDGRPFVVVKDPLRLQYFRLKPEQYALIEGLNGQRSLEELRALLQADFPLLRPSLVEIQQAIAELHSLELAYSSRAGQGETLQDESRRRKRSAMFRAVLNPLFIRVPGVDLDRTLAFLTPLFAWLFHPFAVAAVCLLVVASGVLLATRFDRFEQALPTARQFFAAGNLVLLWLSVGMVKVIHELGHGICCKHFRGECRETGVALMVFSPCLYCDVSDSWLLVNKWHRIAIAAAGMYCELLLAAFAFFIWCATGPGWLNYMCLNVVMVCGIGTVVFNANPLLRYDGYYMLADYLEIPNLRAKADGVLRTALVRFFRGGDAAFDAWGPEDGQVWYGLFSACCAVYRWTLAFAILVVMYRFAKPLGLEKAAMPVLVLATGVVPVRVAIEAHRTPAGRGARNPVRLALSAAMGLTLLVALVCVPVPWPTEASFELEPQGVKRVYVTVAGRLVLVAVRPGQHVRRGEILARLENPTLEGRLKQLQTGRDLLEADVRIEALGNDPARTSVARQSFISAAKEVADLEGQVAQLTIRAPCDGKVVSPQPVHRRASSELTADGRWEGNPLERKNRGCALGVGDHLLDVAPGGGTVAVLAVDQADRNEITVGGVVSLHVNQCPDRTFRATVNEIAEIHGEARQGRDVRNGDETPEAATAKGERFPSSITYRATVTSDELPADLAAGGGGIARWTVWSYSLGGRIWRSLRQTFSLAP